jgi:hypothetical protein
VYVAQLMRFLPRLECPSGTVSDRRKDSRELYSRCKQDPWDGSKIHVPELSGEAQIHESRYTICLLQGIPEFERAAFNTRAHQVIVHFPFET